MSLQVSRTTYTHVSCSLEAVASAKNNKIAVFVRPRVKDESAICTLQRMANFNRSLFVSELSCEPCRRCHGQIFEDRPQGTRSTHQEDQEGYALHRGIDTRAKVFTVYARSSAKLGHGRVATHQSASCVLAFA